MQSLKAYRNKNLAFADLLNWAALVDEGIILNKNGSLSAGWAYEGPDSTAISDERSFHLVAQINRAFAGLGSEWMLHIDACRIPASDYPNPAANHFPDPASALIDAERREQFLSIGEHFTTRYILVVTWLPAAITSHKAVKLLFSEDPEGVPTELDQILVNFHSELGELEDKLSGALTLRRLGRKRVKGYLTDELVDYCRFAVTQQEHHLRLPSVPMFLDSLTAPFEFWSGITPKLDQSYIGAVAIDGFPSETYAAILQALDQVPIACRWSTRFICQDAIVAQSALKSFRRRWQQRVRGFWDQVLNQQPTGKSLMDQDAMTMVGETEAALSEVSSGAVGYGYYTSVVILTNPSPQILAESMKILRRLILNLGFNARIESVNTVEAYLGSLPGHAAENIRRPLLHTIHLGNLLPLSTLFAGSDKATCDLYPKNSPPLLYASSEGTTPFRLNLHLGDVGHSLVFGPTGTGKSTLLGLIAAQFRRYQDASVIIFDKGCSMEILSYCVGGAHYHIGSEYSLCFAPLGQLDQPGELAWASEWSETLMSLQGLKLTPRQRTELNRALKALARSPNKTLTSLQIEIQDLALKEALNAYTINGPYGETIDADSDSITPDRWCCFEIGELMQRDDKIKLPVLTYLFRYIERLAQGQPYLVVLDEAWIMLGHPVFREKIREWLKTLRKANVAVVMATQSLADASRSGILDVLTESCPSKIYLANPDARHPDSAEQYRGLGLIDEEIDAISSMRPKREYYIKGSGSRIVDLRLGPVALALIGSASIQNLQLARALVGENKPFLDSWLNHLEVDYTAYASSLSGPGEAL